MASQKVQLPFDRPFDKLTVLSTVEGLTALGKAERLGCSASLRHCSILLVRLIDQDVHALNFELFTLPSNFDSLRDHHVLSYVKNRTRKSPM